MSYQLSQGETVNLSQLARQAPSQAPVRPVETTRALVARNDLNAVLKAIRVFGIMKG